MGNEQLSLEICPHCGWIEGTQPREAFHLYPRTILNERYMIGNVINFGGFGIIYKAWDTQLSRCVVIKELYPSGIVVRTPGDKEVRPIGGKAEIFQAELRRFLDEARNMAKLEDMPYIVNVFNYFEENHTAYIVMEFLNGITLKQYMEKEGKLPFEDVLRILEPIMLALDEMHKKKLLHRDVAPDNIFITNDNKIKLLDFGTARLAKEDEAITRSIVVKPGYTPPEQYQNKSRQGAWTDVYALGATMYHCLTGEKPEESIDRKINDELKSPKQLGVKLPDYADKAIMKAMALKAGIRFSKMTAFRLALLNKKNVDYPEVEYRRRKRIRAAIVLASIVAVISAGIVAWRYEQRYNVTIEPTNILIWVPAESEEDAAYQSMAQVAQEFANSNAGMTVELKAISPRNYTTQLFEVAGTDAMPDLFRFDVDDTTDLSEFCQSLDYLEHTMDAQMVYFLDKYNDYYPSQLTMPTGFDIPIAYWNDILLEEKNVREDSGKIVSWDEISALKDISSIDINQLPLLSGTTEEVENISNHAKQDFINEDYGLYIGSVKDFADVQNNLGGYYGVYLLEAKEINGYFANCWSVSKTADENTQYAAMTLINFMFNDYMQSVLYVQNDDVLPLNKECFNLYAAEIHGLELGQLDETYLKNLKLWGEEKATIYQTVLEKVS